MILVSFCINDPDNGMFCGEVAGVEIHGVQGCDISLEPRTVPGPRFRMLEGLSKRFQGGREDQMFAISGKVFPCAGWKNWFGNWCWDATRMSGVEVERLIRHLKERGWSCNEASVEFCELFDSLAPDEDNRRLRRVLQGELANQGSRV